jgi:hypothetical protein
MYIQDGPHVPPVMFHVGPITQRVHPAEATWVSQPTYRQEATYSTGPAPTAARDSLRRRVYGFSAKGGGSISAVQLVSNPAGSGSSTNRR